jgi:hypothetical protein
MNLPPNTLRNISLGDISGNTLAMNHLHQIISDIITNNEIFNKIVLSMFFRILH